MEHVVGCASLLLTIQRDLGIAQIKMYKIGVCSPRWEWSRLLKHNPECVAAEVSEITKGFL